MHASKLAGLLATGGAMFAIAAAPAGADPKGETIPLECDNGNAYVVAVSGNGEFTPAHDTASTATFVPLEFGEFTGTFTPPGGAPEPISEPGAMKGQSNKNGKANVTCTFSFSETSEEGTFVASGTVTGFITPRGGK